VSAWNRVAIGDCRALLRDLPDGVFQTCVTSPPYFGLRDYGMAAQIGLEKTPDAYVAELVAVFAEVRRVLREDGTLWLNLGDSYANDAKWGGSSGGLHASDLHGNTGIGRGKKSTGLKSKDLIGIPWRVAFALQADGWYLREDIIWHKPNPMPESVTDRCTRAHEYLFHFAKSPRYYHDADAIREPLAQSSVARLAQPALAVQAGSQRQPGRGGRPTVAWKPRSSGNIERKIAGEAENGRTNTHLGSSVPWTDDGSGRNRRSVWTVTTKPYRGAHFAVMPEALVEPCILAGSRPEDVVLDPFLGSGTVARVAQRLGRLWFGCELNPAYAALIAERTEQLGLSPTEAA
jgi:DNA modification methylase